MIGFYLKMSKVRISAASKDKLEEKYVAENMCSEQNYIFLFLSKKIEVEYVLVSVMGSFFSILKPEDLNKRMKI